MAINPFVWTGPVKDGVPRSEFARHTTLTLKGGTHVAMFGPRGSGKTTFIGELANELAVDHETDAPPWEIVTVDLRRVISLQAFVGAVSTAVSAHPSKELRRKAKAAFGRLEKEIGVNLGLVSFTGRSASRQELNMEEVVHGQLAAISKLADRTVVVFDEFQRLSNCPGEPLSIIRSALTGPDAAGHVSLLLTGSLRERLQLMLHTDTEPIWDQTHDVDLPPLDFGALVSYLELKFEATGHDIQPEAAEHLVELTDAHPKRTQHVAWYVWDRAHTGGPITVGDVQASFDELVASGRDNTDFAKVIDTLLSGDRSELNDVRALFLLASGGSPGSPSDAHRYGLGNESGTTRALTRLRDRGVVQHDGNWTIVDPLLRAWLRRQDPIQLEPRLAPSAVADAN